MSRCLKGSAMHSQTETHPSIAPPSPPIERVIRLGTSQTPPPSFCLAQLRRRCGGAPPERCHGPTAPPPPPSKRHSSALRRSRAPGGGPGSRALPQVSERRWGARQGQSCGITADVCDPPARGQRTDGATKGTVRRCVLGRVMGRRPTKARGLRGGGGAGWGFARAPGGGGGGLAFRDNGWRTVGVAVGTLAGHHWRFPAPLCGRMGGGQRRRNAVGYATVTVVSGFAPDPLPSRWSGRSLARAPSATGTPADGAAAARAPPPPLPGPGGTGSHTDVRRGVRAAQRLRCAPDVREERLCLRTRRQPPNTGPRPPPIRRAQGRCTAVLAAKHKGGLPLCGAPARPQGTGRRGAACGCRATAVG